MFLPIAHLPDTGIGKLPVFADPLKPLADLHPNVVRGGTHVLVGQVKRVHDFSVDVPLELRNGVVADAHRARPSITFPLIQRLLGKPVVAINGEHDFAAFPGTRVPGGVLFHPAHEGSSLLFEPDAKKCIDGECGIAHPGVAVIPVASASDDFRQARGGSGNNRSVGLKGEKLQRQG